VEVRDFAEIEAEFIKRVHTMVWCSVATIDSQNRPRSRVLHPIWEGKTGWISTHRDSYKQKHLAKNPYVSLAYITEIHRPVYVDCKAEWVDDLEQKRHVWNLFKAAPPPLGYDPATEYKDIELDFGVLKLTPWRIDLVSFPAENYEKGTQVWRGGG
jgi:uncharacterized pyridoxamine 5'-phosphate oxidase family protein